MSHSKEEPKPKSYIKEREYYRKSRSVRVTILVNGERYDGETIDLSPSGIRICVYRSMSCQVGQELTLTAHYLRDVFDLQGEIAWARLDPDKTILGIKLQEGSGPFCHELLGEAGEITNPEAMMWRIWFLGIEQVRANLDTIFQDGIVKIHQLPPQPDIDMQIAVRVCVMDCGYEKPFRGQVVAQFPAHFEVLIDNIEELKRDLANLQPPTEDFV
jgi:hypothetical protein